MSQTKEWVAMVTPELLTAWKRIGARHAVDGKPLIGYRTNAKFRLERRNGHDQPAVDTLWTLCHQPYRLPALVARLVVSDVLQRIGSKTSGRLEPRGNVPEGFVRTFSRDENGKQDVPRFLFIGDPEQSEFRP